jgi:hypothetical protein
MGAASSLFQWAALLDRLGVLSINIIPQKSGDMLPYLMPLQGVLTGESLST